MQCGFAAIQRKFNSDVLVRTMGLDLELNRPIVNFRASHLCVRADRRSKHHLTSPRCAPIQPQRNALGILVIDGIELGFAHPQVAHFKMAPVGRNMWRQS